MRRQIICIAAIGMIAVGSASSAFAKPKKKPAADPSNAPIERQVLVPNSELVFKPAEPLVKAQNVRTIEISGSTWLPQGFATASYLPDTTGYDQITVPKIGLAQWHQPTQYIGDIGLSPVFGVSYTQLSRTAQQTFGSQNQTILQRANLITGEAGYHASLDRFSGSQFQPFADLTLQPTLFTATRGPLSNGDADYYLSAGARVGGSMTLSGVARLLQVQRLALSFSVEGSQGILGSPLTGYGFVIGTQIQL